MSVDILQDKRLDTNFLPERQVRRARISPDTKRRGLSPDKRRRGHNTNEKNRLITHAKALGRKKNKQITLTTETHGFALIKRTDRLLTQRRRERKGKRQELRFPPNKLADREKFRE